VLEGNPLASNESKTSGAISDEAIVIKQYQPLIKKLLPFQQKNKLLEGLNKFSSVIPTKVRNIIKAEVIRLTSLTDASADNSDFAHFPVLKFKHFGVSMKLDKVGQEILLRETSRYSDRYTVGVFEAVMNSDHYQSHVKQEQQKKIVDAFSVESQSFQDIKFGVDLSIRPNFTVFCVDFDKGKNCPIASLSMRGMVLETKRTPAIEIEGPIFVFTFPKVIGLTEKTTDITFILEDSWFNKELSVFETRFRMHPSTPKKQIEKWYKYLDKMVNKFPLQRELEIERVMQDLERDRILANCPWIPVFLGDKKGELSPLFELVTPTNAEYNGEFSILEDLPTKKIFSNLLKELEVHKETFLLKGVLESKDREFMVAITHRQASNAGLMKQFIEQATQTDKFSVIQLRLQSIESGHKTVSFDIHDIIANEYPELACLSHILFCKDVTGWIGDLRVSMPEPTKPFPKSIIDDQSRWPISIVMEEQADRRAESRYVMDKPASIKMGMFSQAEATVIDLSSNGLKMRTHKSVDVKTGDTIKVSIKELQVRNQKYEVVRYDSENDILRLKLPTELQQAEGQRLQSMFSNNTQYFNQRDLSIRLRNIHRFLWDVSIRNLPCASVLVTSNRFTIDRLKTVYHKQDCFDLEPFSALANEVPLHGFFADKEQDKPKSPLLDQMLGKGKRDAHVVHAIRKKDNRIIFVDKDEFLFGKVRKQLSAYVMKNALEAYVTHISAMKCNEPSTPLTNKRLAQLSKIDIDMYEKIKTMQEGYTHVLYLSNISSFHNALLRFGIYPEPMEIEKSS
jgi:hypothetical protein